MFTCDKKILCATCGYCVDACLRHDVHDVASRHIIINAPLHVASQTEKFSQAGMILGREVFGKRVGEVILALFPVKVELTLLLSVFQSMIFYVDALRTFFFECSIDESFSCCVINLHRCWWLWMAYFNEDSSDYCSILAILKGCCYFAFCC